MPVIAMLALLLAGLPPGNGATGPANTPRRFTLCHTGGGYNCVVDGDTAWIDGVKVQLADIDAPETHQPRCPYEAELGARATLRLQTLMNEGPFDAAGRPARSGPVWAQVAAACSGGDFTRGCAGE